MILASNIPCESVLYADDTTLLNSNKHYYDLVASEKVSMDCATKWFNANFLFINDDKTENICFSLNHNVNNNFNPVKLLGIHLDSRLSWESHVEKLCTKLARVLYLLRKLKLSVTPDMLMTAYYSFFHSLIAYGITLWGNSSAAHRVFVWQKKAVRVIKGLPAREHCISYFRDSRIMTVPSLYIYSCLLSVKTKLESFQKRQDCHSYSTRQSYMLNLLSCRLEKTHKSHAYSQIKLFNKLPKEAWVASLQKFKSVLSEWLKDRAFYSVKEYLNCDTSCIKF